MAFPQCSPVPALLSTVTVPTRLLGRNSRARGLCKSADSGEQCLSGAAPCSQLLAAGPQAPSQKLPSLSLQPLADNSAAQSFLCSSSHLGNSWLPGGRSFSGRSMRTCLLCSPTHASFFPLSGSEGEGSSGMSLFYCRALFWLLVPVTSLRAKSNATCSGVRNKPTHL